MDQEIRKTRDRAAGMRKRKPTSLQRSMKVSSAGGTAAGIAAAIVEGADDAVVSTALDGVVTSWNPGAARIFGHRASEMVGRPLAGIIPFDLLDEERELLAKIKRGERVSHFDTVRLDKHGRRIAVSVSVSPLTDAAGQIVGASSIARDITERRHAEDALRRANEQAREARIEDAQQARADAESANRAKTEFLAVMSHEIRTPLNSITGFVDLLTNSTELTPQQRRYAGLVKTANAALLTIVNDILDFSKVEVDQLDLEQQPFSPSALLQDTIGIVVPSAREKNLPLDCIIERGVPKRLLGDHARLRQVLLNLLNNAVKFTDRGSITVNVRPQLMTDGRQGVRFSISDTGIGIPAGKHHRLFKPFSQADSSVSRQYGGTGLGLAICKRLVELMGGEIGIVSEVGQGSSVWFTICLPEVSGPAEEPDMEASAEEGARSQARILVIDDIDTNLEIVEAYLQDNGYHVECVSSGPEAIQLLGSARYDLILMDVQMPFMDGIAATKRIRALAAPIRDIPIIAMTGNVMPQQVRTCLEAGMNDHVGKPIERAKLCSNVRRWLPRVENAKKRSGSNPLNFDDVKFSEFVLVVGGERAARIVEKFLASLNDAFRSSPLEAQREAHGLINAAGVLGLNGFVGACRRIAEFASFHDAERARMAIEELRAAQAVAAETVTMRLMPELRGEPIRSRA